MPRDSLHPTAEHADAHLSETIRRVLVAWLLLALPMLGSGCSSIRCKSIWMDGGTCVDGLHGRLHTLVAGHGQNHAGTGGLDPLGMARQRMHQAESYSDWNAPQCIDEFYAANLWAWVAGAQAEGGPARTLSNDSLARLIHELSSHDRWRPASGFTVHYAGETRHVPIEMHGLPWEVSDVQEIRVVGNYYHAELLRKHHKPGFGVPVVVLRHRKQKVAGPHDFLPTTASFAATAVLTPDGSALRLYDPIRIDCAELEGVEVPIAKDPSADLAYALHHHPQTRIQDFLRPNRSQDPSELFFLEPFQEGKIPVVLVHGLLSSPDAWVNVVNELRRYPEIQATYQFWAFKYSTGAPFVRSASELRQKLTAAYTQYSDRDPERCMSRTVLVGHSMGGLISKLMIASSGEDVWGAVANVPLESLVTHEETRAGLAERLYFDPHPMVRRVVFIATPHQGSSVAGRACGRLASALVHPDMTSFEQLLRDNPCAFKETLSNGLPTSIDMLDPGQPFLGTIGRLHLNPEVPLHTILGDYYSVAGHHPSDGVVSVESARHPKASSEVRIAASHNGLLKQDATVQELVRILRLHAACLEPVQPEGSQTEATQLEGVPPDGARSERAQSETVQPETVQPETGELGITQLEIAPPEPEQPSD